MTNEITYSNRQSILTKLMEYRLTPDALVYRDEESKPISVPYSSIDKVTAEFAPSRVQPNRYFLHLYNQDKEKIDITNTHYIGIGDFEDRSKSYVPFVTELHKKILEFNPGANFAKEASWGGYLFSVIMVLFLLGVVAVAGILFVLSGFYWVTLVKLVLIIFYLRSLILYVKRKKPGEYDPGNLTTDILPNDIIR